MLPRRAGWNSAFEGWSLLQRNQPGFSNFIPAFYFLYPSLLILGIFWHSLSFLLSSNFPLLTWNEILWSSAQKNYRIAGKAALATSVSSFCLMPSWQVKELNGTPTGGNGKGRCWIDSRDFMGDRKQDFLKISLLKDLIS